MKLKKILSIFLSLSMVLATVNVPVFAEGEDVVTEPVVVEETVAETDTTTTETESEEASEPEAQADGVIDTEAELAAALAAGGEVILGGSFEVTTEIQIPAGVTATLDLAGYAITSGYQTDSTTKHIYPLNNYGTLTITDSSDEKTGSITGRGIYVQDGSKLTVESGSIYGIDSNGGSALYQYGGDIVINGGLVEQKAEGTYNFAVNAGGGTVTVNGGKIAGNHGAIAATGGTVVINDGEFVCTGSAGFTDNVLYSSGEGSITINGGTFIADGDSAAGGCCIYDANGKTVVYNGDFSNSSGGDVWGTTGTTINGGTFENLTETAHVAIGATITNGGVTYTKAADGTLNEVQLPTEVDTYDKLVAALEAGNDVILTADITATGEINGTDAVIDLNGKKLTLTVGGTNFYGDSTVKNGTIDITGCVADGDCIIGIGDGSNSATLTLDNVNITGNGYSSAYAVLYVYNSSTLNINGGSIVVSNEQFEAGGVIKAHSAANGKINITGTESDPVELTFTDAKIGILDGTVVMNYVDLDITGGANAINQSALTVKNSTLTIKDCDGRALTLNDGNVTIENSTLDFSGATEGEIRFKKALTLNVDESSTIVACDIWTDAEGANVNGTAVTGTEAAPDTVTVAGGTTIIKKVVTGLSGTGTKEDPYLINNLDELKWFRDDVNTFRQDGTSQYIGKYIKLMADIDLDEDGDGVGEEWTPIGSTTADHGSFYGTFDGNGHIISNVVVSKHGTGSGFFAKTSGGGDGPQAVVKNVIFNNVDVNAGNNSSYAGGVIANAGGNTVVENVSVTGYVYVNGYGYVGGMVGHGYPDMSNCSVKAENGSYVHAHYWCAGGIIGYAGEGGTNLTDCTVEGLDVWSAYGAAAAVAGLLQDGNTLTNVSAKDVEVTSASDYCMGYIAGNGEASTLTNVTVTNVTATANGNPITATDAVAKIGDAVYFDIASAFTAAQNGDTVTILKDGTYKLPSTSEKTFTIEGAVDGVVIDHTAAVTMSGSDITFKNVTIECNVQMNYIGFHHAAAERYIKCVINGEMWTYGTVAEFTDCIFNQTSSNAYNLWTYGSSTVKLTKCKLNSAGKSVLLYNEGTVKATALTVDGCEFIASTPVTGKAAIEIDTSLMSGESSVVITDPKATGFAEGSISGNSLWNDKKNKTNITVSVDDEKVWPISYVAQIGETKYKTLAEAIAAATAGDVVIELLDNATMDYNAREAYGSADVTSITINGNGKTLTLNQVNSDWSSIGLANADAKLVLNNMTIEKTGYGDTSGAWNTHAINFKCNVEMTDVTVNNSMSVENGATLNNVTINEANGYYALWINGNGQSVTVNGGAINATNGGRGIKIADEYVGDAVAQVILKVTDTKFNTAKKAAVLVSSTAGAKVTANNVDITNVAADTANFVWVDEDWAGYYNNVKVYEAATKTQENEASFPIKVWYVNGEGVATSVRAYYKNLDDLFAAPATQVPGSNKIELRGNVAAENKVNVNYGSNRVYTFVTDVEGGVVMDFKYADNWNLLPKFDLGENITLNVPYLSVTGGDIEIAGTLNTTYLYLYGTGEGVTITETGVVNANTGDATVQVKGGTVLTVNGELNTSTLNVWTEDTNNSELIVSGANAKVNASHIHAWNPIDYTAAQKVVVANGATLTATNFQADRGSEVTVDAATLTADTLKLGYEGNNGKLTVLNNGVITNGVVLGSVDATVTGPEGMNVTTTVAEHEVLYVNGVYKVIEKPALPTATVKEITDAELEAGNAPELTFALNFVADEATDAQKAYYGNWFVDYVLTVNKDVTFNANGKADGYLAGQYDTYNTGWLSVPDTDVILPANTPFRIMQYASETYMNGDLKITYNDILGLVKDFDCGVYFTPEFMAENPGFEVTLELRMYNPKDETESYAIGEAYKYNTPSAEITYGAYGVGTSGEVGTDSYRENFMVDLYNVYAEKSLVVEMYSGETLISTTTLRESDRDDETAKLYPAKGSKTANIVVDGRLAGSWDTEWHVAPSVEYMPTMIKAYADGVLVSTWDGGFMNDDEADKYIALPGVAKAATVTDAEGNVTYYATLQAALAAVEAKGVVTLLDDIDLTDVKWTPAELNNATFNGNGHKISNLTVTGEKNVGLFSSVVNATIKDVDLVNVTSTGTASVGTLAGSLKNSTVTNVNVSGDIKVTANYMAGGMAGASYGSYYNCSVVGNDGSFVVATHDGASNEGDNVGGFIGHRGEGNGVIENCKVENLKVSGTRKIGGLVGNGFQNNIYKGITVKNVTLETTATSEYAQDNLATFALGGVVGSYRANSKNDGSIQNCTVENITFVIPEAVKEYASLGAITGGLKGETTTVAPVETMTYSNNTADNTTLSNVTNIYLMDLEASVTAADGSVTYYATLADAVKAANAGDTVTLLTDVETDEVIKIENSITINGDGYTVTGSAKKVFEVYADAKINDITIINTAAGGRCVDTRVGNIKVKLDGVTLEAKGVNSQPITVGGTDTTKVELTVRRSTVDAGTSGYAIISFVPVTLVIGETNVSGYGALYMKEGSSGSTVTLGNKAVLTGTNIYDTDSNSFGAIVFETSGVTVNVNSGAKVVADAQGAQPQFAFGFKNGMNTINIEGSVEAAEGNILAGFQYDENALITVTNEEVKAALVADKYVVSDENVVLGKVSVDVDVTDKVIVSTNLAEAGNIAVVALYDDAGRLLATDYVEVYDKDLDNAVVRISTDLTGVGMIKAFLIKDFVTLTPLCEADMYDK